LNKPSAIIIYDWRKESVLVSTTISSPTQDIFIFPDMYVEEKSKDEEFKEERKENPNLAIQDENAEGEEDEEEDKIIDIMGQKKAPAEVEKIVIISKAEITIFDLTPNSLNSHIISIEESEISSEVI
jgi:hypothetical protein